MKQIEKIIGKKVINVQPEELYYKLLILNEAKDGLFHKLNEYCSLPEAENIQMGLDLLCREIMVEYDQMYLDGTMQEHGEDRGKEDA